MSTREEMSIQATSPIIMLTTNFYSEKSIETLSHFLYTLIRKIDLLALPIPEELLRELVLYSTRGRALEEFLSFLQEKLLDQILHGRAWLRVMRPLIDLVYRLPHLKPELEVFPMYTLYEMKLVDVGTIDIVKYVLRTRIDDKIAEDIVTKICTTVRQVEELCEELAEKIFSREPQRPCVVVTSCSYCIYLRKKYEIEHVSFCAGVPPPMQLLQLLALWGRLSRDVVKEVFPFLKKYLLEYVVLSETLTDAYLRFLQENSEYVEVVTRLLGGLRLLCRAS